MRECLSQLHWPHYLLKCTCHIHGDIIAKRAHNRQQIRKLDNNPHICKKDTMMRIICMLELM